MRADVGKIMVTPKGDYDAAVQYERLDIVRDRNNVYLSKDSVKNVSPESDHNKWMKLVDGITPNAIAQASAIYDSVDYAQVVHATGAAENSPTDLNSKIEPVQDFNGYDSPWPGGGGRNLCPPFSIKLTGALRTALFSLDITGTNVYTFSKGGNFKSMIRYYAADGTYIGRGSGGSVMTQTIDGDTTIYNSDTHTGETLRAAGVALFDVQAYDLTDTSDEFIESAHLQVELGSEVTEYAPYENICPIQGRTGVTIDVSETSTFTEKRSYNVSLPTDAGTVYGGVLTVNMDGSATLTVNWAMVDLGAMDYSRSSNGQFYVQAAYSFVRPPASNVLPDLLCDILPICKPAQSTNNEVDFGISLATAVDKRVLVRYNSITDPAELKTALTGHIAVAKLVEPIVYTFPADSILLDYGENYVKSNTGDVSIKYVLDTKTYIDNKIAALMNA